MPSFLFLTLSRMHATSHSLKKYSPFSSLHLPNPILSNQHFDFFLFSALIWFHLPWHSSFLPWQPHIDSLSLSTPLKAWKKKMFNGASTTLYMSWIKSCCFYVSRLHPSLLVQIHGELERTNLQKCLNWYASTNSRFARVGRKSYNYGYVVIS